LKKAIELRPDYYDAHRELAYCHHATGDTDQAIAEYQQASGYRQQTSDSGEMAANNLALSALYTEKGQQVGGAEGEQMTQAGRGYETDAREMDPTLEAAAKVLNEAGLTSRIENHLPPEVRKYLRSSPLPGNIKLPWPRRP
jgi:tetratricopeptide (TPR) repeat protein